MFPTDVIYRSSLSLLTDLYQLTMAYGFWKLGRAREEAVYNLFFRRNAFDGGYTVAAGLGYAVSFLDDFELDNSDLTYLASLRGNDDEPLFEGEFLDYLSGLRLAVDVDAVAEGTVVFPHQPILQVKGPIMQCQILETALLNIINFQSLIATKASRVCAAASMGPEKESVLEFGSRRAQGFDGALAASRAAYVGGCAATSNVLAGKLFGIPVRGTHAHSWVMSFEDELEAFDAYAQVMPNNCVLLVDTYDTLDGVRRACEIGKRLRARGHKLAGIRLDSGDLAYLSIEARAILDAAGLEDTNIVASNDLDEQIILSLKDQGARVSVWGVGTKLATGFDQPALGGVYKLSAIRLPGEEWRYRVKVSEQTAKVSTPGVLGIRRYFSDGMFMADMVHEERIEIPREPTIVDPMDFTRRRLIPAGTPHEELLVPVLRGGAVVYDVPPLAQSRERAGDQLARLHPSIKRFINPHRYPAGLELGLHELKTQLILEARSMGRHEPDPDG